MGIPDHLTCLLRNLYVGQEATVRTGHGTTDSFQLGKGSIVPRLESLFLWKLSSGQFSFSVVSDSLRPHGLQHTWPPCPSPSLTICPCLCIYIYIYIYQFSSVAQLYPTFCDPMDCSTPGLPVHCQLPELTETHVHRVGDAI